MSRKSERIAELTGAGERGELDARYLGFFACFNRQQFFEAHEVLENLWLADRRGLNAAFYKGLIQLAGAFVHLQKNRLRPAAALFRLARANLENYGPVHEQLDVAAVRALSDEWLRRIDHPERNVNLPTTATAPCVRLRCGRN